MTIRQLGFFSILVLLFVGLLFFVSNMYEKDKKEEIMSDMDLRLDSFEDSKVLSRGVKDLISIRTQAEYDEQYNKFRKSMTTSLLDEYFPSKKYVGGKKYFTVKENSATGEIIGKNHFIFKLDLELIEGEYSTPLTLLVYVKNDVIYKIQSLG